MTAEVSQRLRSDARDNRERILAVAGLAFATEGLDVPIREVARRAQVGPATVYRHFPTKEDLLAAVFAEQMEMCSAIVEEGLAAADPWRGFAGVVEKIMQLHARDRGFSRAFISELPQSAGFGTERDRTLRSMARLIRRAKESGELRADIGLEDVILAMMANEGIRAGSPETRAAASKRFAALILQSFHANPSPDPLPPPVHLPI